MNRFEVEELIERNKIQPKYLDAYRNKVLNFFESFFEDVEANKEYEHGDERNGQDEFPDHIEDHYNYQYYRLSFHCVAKLCSDLCISIKTFEDNVIHDKQYGSDIPYVAFKVHDIWSYIQDKIDNMSFLVATISLLTNVSKGTAFGRWFSITVRKVLKEYKMGFILEELPKESVFIAMSFNKGMEKARNKIKQAISDSGYTAILIDEKEHNNSIVPEIFYEIERSNFIIADFTGNRGGVYYEAGYAKALKKEVIMTVRESDFENVHFDTKQVSHVIWKDEEDLYQKLLKRIETTI